MTKAFASTRLSLVAYLLALMLASRRSWWPRLSTLFAESGRGDVSSPFCDWLANCSSTASREVSTKMICENVCYGMSSERIIHRGRRDQHSLYQQRHAISQFEIGWLLLGHLLWAKRWELSRSVSIVVSSCQWMFQALLFWSFASRDRLRYVVKPLREACPAGVRFPCDVDYIPWSIYSRTEWHEFAGNCSTDLTVVRCGKFIQVRLHLFSFDLFLILPVHCLESPLWLYMVVRPCANRVARNNKTERKRVVWWDWQRVFPIIV